MDGERNEHGEQRILGKALPMPPIIAEGILKKRKRVLQQAVQLTLRKLALMVLNDARDSLRKNECKRLDVVPESCKCLSMI